MPISMECDCGKLFKVLDDLAGKRVKCPACKDIVAVPSADEEPSSSDDDGGGEDRPLRKKKKKKKQAAGGSKIGLWIALAAGVLVLGFCCVGMGGGGYYFLVMSKSPEKTLIGVWQVDAAEQQKNDPNPMVNGVRMEFLTDGTLRATDLGQTFTRQWKLVKTEGNIVIVEISGGGFPNTIRATVTVVDNDHLRYQAPTLMGHMLYMKRVGAN